MAADRELAKLNGISPEAISFNECLTSILHLGFGQVRVSGIIISRHNQHDTQVSRDRAINNRPLVVAARVFALDAAGIQPVRSFVNPIRRTRQCKDRFPRGKIAAQQGD